MCSADAERDVCCASDVPFGRDVCLRHVSGTHHITATAGSNITFAACGKNITCADGANITLQSLFQHGKGRAPAGFCRRARPSSLPCPGSAGPKGEPRAPGAFFASAVRGFFSFDRGLFCHFSLTRITIHIILIVRFRT